MIQLLRTGQIAKLLDTSPDTVRRLIDAGHIDAHRLTTTGPRRVKRVDLERFAKEKSIPLRWEIIDTKK